jgi:dolichyl-phosphate beta-glucosyltransferase
MTRLSIVIPAYNEQFRLKNTCEEYKNWCVIKAIPFEIIIVNNGSRDNTERLVNLLSQRHQNIKGITLSEPGKGLAVKTGVLCSKGDYILVADADCATKPDQIAKLIRRLEEGADLAIGSRNIKPYIVSRSAPRKLIATVMNYLANFYLQTRISDHFCGFKMYKKQSAQDIFARQKIIGFSADPEVLFIAQKFGYEISEVPIEWREQPGSKVKLRDIFRIIWDLLSIKDLHRISS